MHFPRWAQRRPLAAFALIAITAFAASKAVIIGYARMDIPADSDRLSKTAGVKAGDPIYGNPRNNSNDSVIVGTNAKGERVQIRPDLVSRAPIEPSAAQAPSDPSCMKISPPEVIALNPAPKENAGPAPAAPAAPAGNSGPPPAAATGPAPVDGSTGTSTPANGGGNASPPTAQAGGTPSTGGGPSKPTPGSTPPLPQAVAKPTGQESASRSPAAEKPSADRQNVADSSSLSQMRRGSHAIAAESAHRETIERAEKQQEKLEKSAQEASSTLSKAYERMPPPEQQQRAQEAAKKLDKLSSQLAQTKSGLEPSESARFALLAKNAADKARALASDIAAKRSSTILSQEKYPPTSQDALVDRMIQYYGLKADERAKVDKKLPLKEEIKIKTRGGEALKASILHNGYVLHNGRSNVTCSRFISLIMPKEFRGLEPTTFDLEQIWNYLYRGRITPLAYENNPERARRIARASTHFEARSPIEGHPLSKGDILLYRVPGEAVGHVVLVKDYNPETFDAVIVEASQSAGTIHQRVFRYTMPGTAIPKPGLFILRRRVESAPLVEFAGGGSK